MLPEMRRTALLIFMRTLVHEEFAQDMERMIPAILKALAYISPGPWVVWPGIPRPGYARRLRELDEYLYKLVRARRRKPIDGAGDLLSLLLSAGMDDDLIRDQLLTMLIAGHDTSTALLAWTLYLLGKHPDVMAQVRTEIDAALGDRPPDAESVATLPVLDQVISEAMRLYPPIHIGNRIAANDLEFRGYRIPAGSRVVYSIYLTHRHPDYWHDPDRFDPGRFAPDQPKPDPYAYLPFGGGSRNCIGRAFALIESKVVLSRLIQQFDMELGPKAVYLHMGATLEPRPGVRMRVWRRK
jgi:cytochrome P450